MPAKCSIVEDVEKFVGEAISGYEPVYRTEKVIRDTVGGFVKLYSHEVSLLDSPLFQRLRNIFQTSLAIYTYPTANHTRFEHSLGCLSMADKIIGTLNARHGGMINIQEQYVIRLAALLHDIGHPPFSHASESYFEHYPELEQLRTKNRDLFFDAAPHEILGYLILKTKAFNELWSKVVAVCEPEKSGRHVLDQVRFDHVAPLLLGQSYNKEKKYVAQIINGPFDVDKIDYLQRDGYFSGIQTALDVDRLFLSIGVHNDKVKGEEFLYTDIGGATVLEQITFNKMILFSSMYHHHKVRAGLVELHFLYDFIRENKKTIKGLSLNSVVDFLRLDDYDVLNGLHDKSVAPIIERIKNRKLLRRALVICPQSLENKKSPYYSAIQMDDRRRAQLRKEICGKEFSKYDVYIDCPRPASFQRGTLESMIRISEGNFVGLDQIYPVSGWVKGYAEYRYRGYVFAREGHEKKVADKAYEILRSKGLLLNKNAFLLAKQSPNAD